MTMPRMRTKAPTIIRTSVRWGITFSFAINDHDSRSGVARQAGERVNCGAGWGGRAGQNCSDWSNIEAYRKPWGCPSRLECEVQGNFLNGEASDFRCRSKVTEQYCTVFLALHPQHSYQVPTPNAVAVMPDRAALSLEGSTPSTLPPPLSLAS